MRFRVSQANGFPLLKINQRYIKGGNLGPFQYLIFFALKIFSVNQNLLRSFSRNFRMVSKGTDIVFPTQKLTSKTEAESVISALWIDSEG